MNLGTQDRELSDLLDFTAMFNPPNGGPPSANRAGAVSEGSPVAPNVHGSTPSSRQGIEDSWTSYDNRPFEAPSSGNIFGEDDSELLASSRKTLSSSTYLSTPSATQGKSKEVYGSLLLGNVPQQPSNNAPQGRRTKGSKSNHHLRSVYSPGAEDILPHSAGMYPTESYYLDGGSPDPWGHHITGTNSIRNQVSHSIPVGYGEIHHEIGYQTLADPADSRLPATLPPMSTFRQTSSAQPNTSYLQNTIPSPVTSSIPQARIGSASSQTADALGKALASMYSTDTHSNPSYSSNPSTPVSSPPPLISDRSSAAGAAPAATTSSHSNPAWPHVATSQAGAPPFDHLQTLSRMEERLDDALWVLKSHAENANICNPLTGLPYPPGSLPQSLTESLQNAASLDAEHSLESASSLIPNPALSTQEHGDEKAPPKSKSQSQKSRKRAVRVESQSSEKRDTDPGNDIGSEDDDDSPNKGAREQERRYANNARERLRVRDINEAFKELGRMCNIHIKTEKPQSKPYEKAKASIKDRDRDSNSANCSKLVILHQAVSVITSLESQVRERNLNPKTACLKRREEEKVDETPEKRLAMGSVSSDNKRNGRRGVATVRRDEQVLMEPPVFSH